MSYDKFDKFESWINKYPHLKGGNNFVKEKSGEYCSSWVQSTYESFLELEKENLFYFNLLDSREAEIVKLKKENALLKKALEFYAHIDSWGSSDQNSFYRTIDVSDMGKGDFIGGKYGTSEDVNDGTVGGRLARETLEEIDD